MHFLKMYTLQYFVYQIIGYDDFTNMLTIPEKAGSMNFYNPSEKSVDESSATYTLRSISPVTDANVTEEARTAGKAKGTYAREFIEEQLGDPITSWIRSNGLVASMDDDLAQSCDAILTHERYEICISVQEAHAYRALLNINSNADLKRVLFDNAAHLHYQAAKELMLRQTVPRGTSMRLALFCELAGREKQVVDEAWLQVFFNPRPDAYEKYLDDIDAVRERKKLPALGWSIVHNGQGATVKIRRPDGYDYGAWRVQISLHDDNPALHGNIPLYPLSSRLLIADPGYNGITMMKDGIPLPAVRFIGGRCELHLYTNGVSEENNPVTVSDTAVLICESIESHML
ncbi:hypothetical protein [Erwinia billingiae]|uniref:hypothetical protein n=1 Tax=Erwinia billingiae TaxID=182337 RepID=UPI002245CABF|nr:hypothetical protein [Erwinia billingiae]MCX0498987.1 hypothetical protein [Erwinia billingiae]